MSFFAWQSNKIILFYFTKNFVSEINLALVYREAELSASVTCSILNTNIFNTLTTVLYYNWFPL